MQCYSQPVHGLQEAQERSVRKSCSSQARVFSYSYKKKKGFVEAIRLRQIPILVISYYSKYCELIDSLVITRRIVSANISAIESCLTFAQRFE